MENNIYSEMNVKYYVFPLRGRFNVMCDVQVGSIHHSRTLCECVQYDQALKIVQNFQNAYNKVLFDDKISNGFFLERNFA